MNAFTTIAGYIVKLIDTVIADIIMFSLLAILLIYYRTYKELNGEECERVNHVRCPECKICNCAVKADEKKCLE